MKLVMNPLKGPLKLKGDVSLVSKKKSKRKKKDKDKADQTSSAAVVESRGEDVQSKVGRKYAALTVQCHILGRCHCSYFLAHE